MTDNSQKTDGTTRRTVLAALASAGVLGASSAAAASDVGVGGGPMSDELSHLNVEVYAGPESELPEPGIEGRYYHVDDGGALWNAGDILEDTGDTWEKIDAGVGSLSAGSANITERWDFKPGYQISTGPVAETPYYDHEPYLIRTGTDLLVIYREGASHGISSGSIVQRRSNDFGETWSESVIVADDHYDDRNPSVVRDPDSGRLTVFWRAVDDNSDYVGTFAKTSDDGGQTWGSSTDISSQLASSKAPIGGGVVTSNGLFTTFYTGVDGGIVEGLFSSDGGETWGDVVTVADTTNAESAVSESCPVAIDKDRLIVYGRENTTDGTGRFFAVKSDDGGQTWGNIEYFDILNNEYPTPIYVDKTKQNEITAIVGRRTNDREDGQLYAATFAAEVAWDDPTALGTADWGLQSRMRAADNEDFGYPSLVTLGGDDRHTIMAWHDEVDPNIYIGSLASSSDGRGGDRNWQEVYRKTLTGTIDETITDLPKVEEGLNTLRITFDRIQGKDSGELQVQHVDGNNPVNDNVYSYTELTSAGSINQETDQPAWKVASYDSWSTRMGRVRFKYGSPRSRHFIGAGFGSSTDFFQDQIIRGHGESGDDGKLHITATTDMEQVDVLIEVTDGGYM